MNSFVGCILGLAIGDALGFPAEFRRREQILRSFGAAGLTDFVAIHDPRWPARPVLFGKRHPPGTFSDFQPTRADERGVLGYDLRAKLASRVAETSRTGRVDPIGVAR